MLKAKKFYKYAWIIPAVVGLSLMAFASVINESQDQDITKDLQYANEITVDRLVHDFGTVKEDGGNVSTVFIVTNNTNAPISILEAKASCSCTTSDRTKEPIEPGKTGKVTATYNPKGRPGPFEKSITIISDGNPERLIVRIKGTVV